MTLRSRTNLPVSFCGASSASHTAVSAPSATSRSGVRAAHVGLDPARTDRVDRDRAAQFGGEDRGDGVERRLRHAIGGVTAAIVASSPMPLDMLTMRPDVLRLSNGTSDCARCNGPSVLVSSVARTRGEIDLQRRRFAFGDDAGVVDEHVEVGRTCPSGNRAAPRCSCRSVTSSGWKFSGEFLRREFLDRRRAARPLACRQTTLRAPRAASCRQISKPMPRLPPVTTTIAGRSRLPSPPLTPRLVQQLERVRPLVAEEARDAPQHAQRLDRARGLDACPCRRSPSRTGRGCRARSAFARRRRCRR